MYSYLWAMLILMTTIEAVTLAPNSGAEYLQSAIRDLDLKKNTNPLTLVRKIWSDRTRSSPAIHTQAQTQTLQVTNAVAARPARLSRPVSSAGTYKRADQSTINKTPKQKQDIPELSLTKGELLSLYETAVANGDTVKLGSQPDDPDGPQLHVPFYDMTNHQATGDTANFANDVKGNQQLSGYYYYYYPLNSFLDGQHDDKQMANTNNEVIHPTMHSHTHQHNVKIESSSLFDSHHKTKALEPLFMAISSFVGMALMFVFSMVFLPKLGGIKSRRVETSKTPNSSHQQQIISLSTIVMKAIEGHDCSERISCEIGKTLKALKLHDNRFTKLLQRVVPTSFSKRIDTIRKHAIRNNKCNMIQCKRSKAAAKTANMKHNKNEANKVSYKAKPAKH